MLSCPARRFLRCSSKDWPRAARDFDGLKVVGMATVASSLFPPTAATWDSARCGSTTSPEETLTLIAESLNHDMFDGPDNVCVSPRGGLVFCEDATAAQFVRGVTRTGEVFGLARNLRNSIEFAGACFSPDGETLFVNLYGRGNERTTQPYRSPVQIPVGPERFERAATVAIWGPWRSGPL